MFFKPLLRRLPPLARSISFNLTESQLEFQALARSFARKDVKEQVSFPTSMSDLARLMLND